MIGKIRKGVVFALFAIGLFFLLGQDASITGAVIGTSSTSSSVIGFFIIFAAGLLLATAHQKIELRSSINDKSLQRLTIQSTRNEKVQKDINHLVQELHKGNLEAGLGKPGHIDGTDIHYMRARNGARLFYHEIERQDNKIIYEIVAKSDKPHEDQVIDKLKQLYSN